MKKIQVLHDEQGNILSFAIVKSGVTDGLTLVPKKNQSVKVVDMPTTKGEKLTEEEDFKRLVDTLRKQKIDTKSEVGKLVPK